MVNAIYFVVALLLTAVILHFLIPLLRRVKFGQPVYELAPENHQKKQGIPTMGGLAFILVISLMSLVTLGLGHDYIFVVLGMLLFAMLGFLDDVIKVTAKHNQGLTEWQKIAIQVVFSLLIAFLVRDNAQQVLIPFTSKQIDLGILYYPFVVIFLLAMTNSANLTDGLDGLLTSVTIPMIGFFAFVTYYVKDQTLFSLSIIILGALLGFLAYNRHPAQVFMGDTGSMAIGAIVGVFLLITRTPIYALILCIIYVVESLSDILQVAYYKKTKKRIFKMAPIHHHFEKSGYSETTIVLMFAGVSVIALILSLVGYMVK